MGPKIDTFCWKLQWKLKQITVYIINTLKKAPLQLRLCTLGGPFMTLPTSLKKKKKSASLLMSFNLAPAKVCYFTWFECFWRENWSIQSKWFLTKPFKLKTVRLQVTTGNIQPICITLYYLRKRKLVWSAPAQVEEFTRDGDQSLRSTGRWELRLLLCGCCAGQLWWREGWVRK